MCFWPFKKKKPLSPLVETITNSMNQNKINTAYALMKSELGYKFYVYVIWFKLKNIFNRRAYDRYT